MALWTQIVGGSRQPRQTAAERMKAALEERFPDNAANGFTVEFKPSRIAGQGVYTVRTTSDFSRQNWSALGLTETRGDQPGQYTRHPDGMITTFMFPQAALEKALGVREPGRRPGE